MTIQKANTIKFFRYLAIFCAITMGFFSIVATSSEDAKDALGITIPFNDEEAEMELETVTVEKGIGGDLAQPMEEFTCQTKNILELLTIAIDEFNVENDLGEDVSVEDIDDITYDYVSGWYNIHDVVGDITDTVCTVKLFDGDMAELIEITRTEDMVLFDQDVQLVIDEPGLQPIIEYYLMDENLGENFTVCGRCTETDLLESYSIDFDVDIGIFVSGEI